MNNIYILLEKYKKANRVVSMMDSRFDYDTLCANLVLKEFSDSIGVEHDIYFEGVIPEFANKLIDKNYLKQIKQNTDIDSINFDDYDLLFMIDSSTYKHVKSSLDFELPKDITIVNIDHHKTNKSYGNINFVDTSLTSACSVLYSLLKETDFSITKEVAQMLFLGIYTDSGFFQFDTVSPDDLKYASELMEKGASLYDISYVFNYSESYEEMKLKALVYGNLVADFDREFAYSVITKKDLEDYGLDLGKTNTPPADLIKQLNGVDFVFVIKELENNEYNVSLRSHSKNYVVLPIAEKFGGGGHKMAAGFNIEPQSDNPIEEIVKKTIS